MGDNEEPQPHFPPAIEANIVELRDAGAPWNAIQQQFGLTRQQARYAYQRGKRTQRRAARRSLEIGDE